MTDKNDMSPMIRSLDANYLEGRLQIPSSEAEKLLMERRENQRLRMPGLAGEFVMYKMGFGDFGGQLSCINAIEQTRLNLGLPTLVYGGYNSENFVKHGSLDGPFVTPRQRERIFSPRIFCASTIKFWRENAGYAAHNPFDHMSRNDGGRPMPIIVGYEHDCLESPHGADSADPETVVWRPKNNLSIDETVRIVFLGSGDRT